jgi:hypothetical protein
LGDGYYQTCLPSLEDGSTPTDPLDVQNRARASSLTDNTPYGGGLNSDVNMTWDNTAPNNATPGGCWASDGYNITVQGFEGWAANTNCTSTSTWCNLACSLGAVDIGVTTPGLGGPQVRQFNIPSWDDLNPPSGDPAVDGVAYDIWESGGVEYLTVHRPTGDQFFSR